MGVICLLAGALFGLMSVYSNSRETCAVWVLVALAFAFVAGLLLRPTRSMSFAELRVLDTCGAVAAIANLPEQFGRSE